MITKQKLQEKMVYLNDDFSINELLDRLLLIEKIDKGIHQSEHNKVISEDELSERIKKW
jgi:hypothetical protein